MSVKEWNPSVDEIIMQMGLNESEIESLMAVAPTAFEDPYDNPVWYQEIRFMLPVELRNKIDNKSLEVDFGW